MSQPGLTPETIHNPGWPIRLLSTHILQPDRRLSIIVCSVAFLQSDYN